MSDDRTDHRAVYGSTMNWDAQRAKQEAVAEGRDGEVLDPEEVLEDDNE